MARCEWACYDTMALCHDLTMTYQDELHRPAFPYKFKFKMAGCPNDCVASIARSDLSIIGTWKDDIQVNQAKVAEYIDGGLDVEELVVMKCPTRCMRLKGKELQIENSECVKCMHCINVMPKALKPGKERGAALLMGAKAPIVQGAQISSMFVPFVPIEPPYDDIKEFIEAVFDIWAEEGKNRERVGEFIQRVGFGNFLDAIGLEPDPKMIAYPRDNPYIFFEQEGDDEDEE